MHNCFLSLIKVTVLHAIKIVFWCVKWQKSLKMPNGKVHNMDVLPYIGRLNSRFVSPMPTKNLRSSDCCVLTIRNLLQLLLTEIHSISTPIQFIRVVVIIFTPWNTGIANDRPITFVRLPALSCHQQVCQWHYLYEANRLASLPKGSEYCITIIWKKILS